MPASCERSLNSSTVEKIEYDEHSLLIASFTDEHSLLIASNKKLSFLRIDPGGLLDFQLYCTEVRNPRNNLFTTLSECFSRNNSSL